MRGKLSCGAAAFALMSAAASAAVPPELVPREATKVTQNGDITEFDIAADPFAVDAFYHKLLPSQGYSVTGDVRSPAAISFFFNRGAMSEGSIVIRVRGDVSHVVLKFSQ